MAQGLVYNPTWNPGQSQGPGSPYGYGGGSPIGVGWGPGTNKQQQGYSGLQAPGGGSLGGGFFGGGANYQAAFDDRQGRLNSNFGNATKALGNSFSQGPFGQGLFDQFQNGQMLSPEEMQLQRNMLAQVEAGRRTNSQMNFRQRGTAAGFGDSVGMNAGLERIANDSAGNLMRGYNELTLGNAEKRQQVRMQAAQTLMQLYGLDQQTAQHLADLWASKNEDAFVGQGEQGQGMPVQGGWNY